MMKLFSATQTCLIFHYGRSYQLSACGQNARASVAQLFDKIKPSGGKTGAGCFELLLPAASSYRINSDKDMMICLVATQGLNVGPENVLTKIDSVKEQISKEYNNQADGGVVPDESKETTHTKEKNHDINISTFGKRRYAMLVTGKPAALAGRAFWSDFQ